LPESKGSRAAGKRKALRTKRDFTPYDTPDLYFLDLHSACIQSTSAGLGTLLREKSPFLLIRTDTGWQIDNSFIYIKK